MLYWVMLMAAFDEAEKRATGGTTKKTVKDVWKCDPGGLEIKLERLGRQANALCASDIWGGKGKMMNMGVSEVDVTTRPRRTGKRKTRMVRRN